MVERERGVDKKEEKNINEQALETKEFGNLRFKIPVSSFQQRS